MSNLQPTRAKLCIRLDPADPTLSTRWALKGIHPGLNKPVLFTSQTW